MPFAVKVEGIDRLLPLLSGSLYRPEVAEAMEAGLRAVEKRAKALAPEDRGDLKGSITHRLEAPTTGLLGYVYTDSPYALYVHEGRRAGARPPPSSALTGWLGRHGMDPKLAFVVARAIGRRGIPARPFLRQALEDSRAAIDHALDLAAKRIERKWAGK